MTDAEKREKVVRGLEILRETRGCNDVYYTDCENCVYNGVYRCVDSILKDALALLKAQEPVEPSWRRGIPFCGKCGRQFGRGFKYCPDCGRAVKWE